MDLQPVGEGRTLNMSFDRKIAAFKVRSREEAVNLNLVKLFGFVAEPLLRELWQRDIGRSLLFFSSMRLRPNSALIPAKCWMRWLYDQPFGGNEDAYTSALIKLVPDVMRNQLAISKVHAEIKGFHKHIGAKLASGRSGIGHLMRSAS